MKATKKQAAEQVLHNKYSVLLLCDGVLIEGLKFMKQFEFNLEVYQCAFKTHGIGVVPYKPTLKNNTHQKEAPQFCYTKLPDSIQPFPKPHPNLRLLQIPPQLPSQIIRKNLATRLNFTHAYTWCWLHFQCLYFSLYFLLISSVHAVPVMLYHSIESFPSIVYNLHYSKSYICTS